MSNRSIMSRAQVIAVAAGVVVLGILIGWAARRAGHSVTSDAVSGLGVVVAVAVGLLVNQRAARSRARGRRPSGQ